MRNLKRALSLALASVMLLGMMVIGTSAASNFTDADKIVNTEAAAITGGLGIFAGANGEFMPEKEVTRAEMATIIVKMLYGNDFNANPFKGVEKFSDVADYQGGWAEGYINLCANLKVVGGYGDGTFKPGKVVTTAEAATMILNALKVDAGAGEWPLTVMAKATEIKLFGDLLLPTDQPLTRDNLSVLVKEGLFYSPSGTKGYVVDGVAGIVFDSFVEAYIASGSDVSKIHPNTAKDTLAKTVYGVEQNTDNDDFGRVCTVYTSTKNTEFEAKIPVSKPVVTYTDKAVKSSDLYKVLKAEYAAAKTEIIVNSDATEASSTKVVSGKVDASNDVANSTFAISQNGTGIKDAKIGGDGMTVEVYKDGDKVKLVVIQTLVDTILSVDTKKGTVTFTTATDLNEIKATGLEKGDVVLYTKGNLATNKYDVVSIKKAESFVGTITSFTNDTTSKFTVNGSTYTVGGNAATGVNDTALKNYLGQEKVYYLNDAGNIIKVGTIDNTEVIKDYAVIVAANVKKTNAAWPATGFTVTAQIQAVLSDGTIGVYDLPLTKATADIATTSIQTGDFYFKNGSSYVPVYLAATQNGSTNDQLTNALVGQLNGVYTYAVSGSAITLKGAVAAFDGNETESKVTTHAPAAAITKSTIVDETVTGKKVILNDKTVFILRDTAKNTITVKTGVANLGNTNVPTSAKMIIDVTKPSSGSNVNVAKIVFADVAYSAGGATQVDEYVYVDGKCTVTKNSKDELVYTYTGVKVDGTKISLTGADASVTAGIYKYNSNNELVSISNTTQYTIGAVSGDVVELGSGNFKLMTSKTKTVVVAEGATLATGAKAYAVLGSGDTADQILVIFLTKKA